MMVVFGTKATTLDDKTAKEMIKTGVASVGISIDSASPKYHDLFRGAWICAWEKAIDGIESCKKAWHRISDTDDSYTPNYNEIQDIIELSHKIGSRVFNLFFLVCTRRGQDITDISAEQYEETLQLLLDIQGK